MTVTKVEKDLLKSIKDGNDKETGGHVYEKEIFICFHGCCHDV